MWMNILKKPITIGSTKIGLKPLPEEEEDECNNQLKAYADKIKSKQMYIKDAFNSKYMDPWREQFTVKKDESSKNTTMYTLDQVNSRAWVEPLFEHNYYNYSPIPEKVACKALEMLKNEQAKENEYDYEWTKEKVDEFEIVIKFTYNYQYTALHLVIWEHLAQEPSISIGCLVGEDVAPFPDGVPFISGGATKEDNMYYAIAFYEARNNLDWR